MLVAVADWTNVHDRNVPQVALKAVWDAVLNHSVLLAMLMENEEGTIRFFNQRTGDGPIAAKRNILELIASGRYPGGRNFVGNPGGGNNGNAGGVLVSTSCAAIVSIRCRQCQQCNCCLSNMHCNSD